MAAPAPTTTHRLRTAADAAASGLPPLLVQARDWAKRLECPVRLWMSDKQDAFVTTIAEEFSGVPHRYCGNHFLRDLAKPMLELDSHAKVQMRSKIRGLRAIEREALQCAGDLVQHVLCAIAALFAQKFHQLHQIGRAISFQARHCFFHLQPVSGSPTQGRIHIRQQRARVEAAFATQLHHGLGQRARLLGSLHECGPAKFHVEQQGAEDLLALVRELEERRLIEICS